MTAFTPTAPNLSPEDDVAFDRARRLLETELDARPLSDVPAQPVSRLHRVRRHKAALVHAINRSCHIHYLTEAFRVVDAAYPYLDENRLCTEAAVAAACEPLYGGLARYAPFTQDHLRSEARNILTSALASVVDSREA